MTNLRPANSTAFHLRHAWFNVCEQYSEWQAGIAGFILIPFFTWLLSRTWQRFNGSQGHFSLSDAVIYIGMTELLFMTFVRSASVSRASSDFSLALARPRSWLMTSFSGIVGRSTGGRLLALSVLVLTLPFIGASVDTLWRASLRLAILLPWLGLLQGLFALGFATAQVQWPQTDYFLAPFGKIFLVLGGVWGPLADFAEPWRSILLKLPPSDLFFQPAYFCAKGEFYQTSVSAWVLRTSVLALCLVGLNIGFYRRAKSRHMAFGG